MKKYGLFYTQLNHELPKIWTRRKEQEASHWVSWKKTALKRRLWKTSQNQSSKSQQQRPSSRVKINSSQRTIEAPGGFNQKIPCSSVFPVMRGRMQIRDFVYEIVPQNHEYSRTMTQRYVRCCWAIQWLWLQVRGQDNSIEFRLSAGSWGWENNKLIQH